VSRPPTRWLLRVETADPDAAAELFDAFAVGDMEDVGEALFRLGRQRPGAVTITVEDVGEEEET
jgi:hypothetical protein